MKVYLTSKPDDAMVVLVTQDENGVIKVATSKDCCCGDKVHIVYSWEGTGMRDLDTATTFLDATVGWSCGSNNQYIEWGGDNTQSDQSETVDVDVLKARADNLWSGSVQILLAAGWYKPAQGSGPATVRVTYKNVTKTKTISPGTQSTCASGSPVGYIVVHGDGTFDLE